LDEETWIGKKFDGTDFMSYRRALRENIRHFILFIRLRGMEEPGPVAETFSVKEILKVLREFEEEYGEEIAEKFFVIED
jgi:hypothetical protein